MNKMIKQNNIEKNVMSRITDDKTVMRPHSYYVYISIFGVSASVLFGFVTVYFASVASLWFRVIAVEGAAYGAKRNLASLIETFPWWAVLLGIASVTAIIYLIKKVGHLYKIRTVYLVFAIVLVSIMLGFMLSYTNLPGLMSGERKNSIVCNIDGADCSATGSGYGRGRSLK